MGRLIYGGSFNPLHVAHMRLAIESLELLANFASDLDFVPVANPPHKPGSGLLPFSLRAAIIRSVIKDMPHMRCQELEARREGPSYTVDTLEHYRSSLPGEELYFLLGSQDYALLPQWHRWAEFPLLANLAVAPRGDFRHDDFLALTDSLWPHSTRDKAAERLVAAEGSLCVRVPDGRCIFYLPLPRLEISASHIRDLWLAGRNPEYLLPRPALDMINAERKTVLARWGNDRTCSM